MFALTFIIQKALNKPMKNLLKKPKKSLNYKEFKKILDDLIYY